MLSMVRNQRKYVKGVEDHDAGTFLSFLNVPSEVSRDPRRFRQTVQKGYHWSPGSIPSGPILRAQVMSISSWATARRPDQPLVPKESEWIFHCPHTSFIKNVPMDIAVVFDMNPDTLGVMHNFSKRLLTAETSQALNRLRPV